MALLPTSIAAIVEAISESVSLREVVLGPVQESIVNSVEGGKFHLEKIRNITESAEPLRIVRISSPHWQGIRIPIGNFRKTVFGFLMR